MQNFLFRPNPRLSSNSGTINTKDCKKKTNLGKKAIGQDNRIGHQIGQDNNVSVSHNHVFTRIVHLQQWHRIFQGIVSACRPPDKQGNLTDRSRYVARSLLGVPQPHRWAVFAPHARTRKAERKNGAFRLRLWTKLQKQAALHNYASSFIIIVHHCIRNLFEIHFAFSIRWSRVICLLCTKTKIF